MDTSQLSSSSSQEISEPKRCWICLGTDDDDNESKRDWVSPCKCCGSTQWVHQICVLRWVEEKLKQNVHIEACCPQCQTKYIIVHDKVNYFVRVLNILDDRANQIDPYVTLGTGICTIYWSAGYYGVLILVQVMGEIECIRILENTNKYMLLSMLPLIPLSLILTNAINWEDTILLFAQRFILQLPLFRTIMPSFLSDPVINSTSTVQFNSSIDLSTAFCNTLFLPFSATEVGNLLFDKYSSYSHLRKTLLGGLVYIAVKCVLGIYKRQYNNRKYRSLRIMNCPETDTEEIN